MSMARLLPTLLASLLLLQGAGSLAVERAPFGDPSAFNPAQTSPQSAELDRAAQLNQKVVQLFKDGKIDEALPLAQQVLQIREKALGRDHQLVIEALLNLAELKLHKSFYRESRSLYERILKSNEKLAGPDDPSNIVLLDKLGYLSYMSGYFPEGEKYYKRSLALNEKVYAPESEQVAQALYNLAEFYRFTKKYQMSEPFYRRALEIRDKTLQPDDPKLVKTVERYRCLFYQTEREDKLKAFDEERAALYKSKNPDAPLDVINGRALSLPKPTYPPEARAVRARGVVVMKVTIDESGSVIKAESMCGGDAWLVRASTEAAMRARFTPTIVSGQPIKLTGIITYRFTF